MSENKSPGSELQSGSSASLASLWQRAQGWLRGLGKPSSADVEPGPAEIREPCCGPNVHIAYRGKSDDRLYVAYNRTWEEVRYFQPNGLRAFCSGCRRRLL